MDQEIVRGTERHFRLPSNDDGDKSGKESTLQQETHTQTNADIASAIGVSKEKVQLHQVHT